VSTPSESALAKRASRGLNRAAVVDANFIELVQGLAPAERRRPAPHEPLAPGSRLTAGEFLEVFRCQLLSRHLDLQAREPCAGATRVSIPSAAPATRAMRQWDSG
jgi:2-oxoisovalerate dehydrogenase E1 component